MKIFYSKERLQFQILYFGIGVVTLLYDSDDIRMSEKMFDNAMN